MNRKKRKKKSDFEIMPEAAYMNVRPNPSAL